MRYLFIILVAFISLQSCEKPELVEAVDMEVKGWSSDLFIENNSKTSKTSKTTSVDYTLEIYGEQDIIDTLPTGQDVYEALIIDGDINDDHTILGSVVYYIDGAGFLAVSITRNDANGNVIGETEHVHTDSYEIVYKG